MNKESIAFARQKKQQNVMRRERGQALKLNYLSCFYCCSNRAYSVVSSSRLHVWCETPFRSSKWGLQLSAVFSSSSLVSNYMSLPRHFRPPTNSFSVFYPWPNFPFEHPSANQNSLSICCWYFSIFNSGVTNYFT